MPKGRMHMPSLNCITFCNTRACLALVLGCYMRVCLLLSATVEQKESNWARSFVDKTLWRFHCSSIHTNSSSDSAKHDLNNKSCTISPCNCSFHTSDLLVHIHCGRCLENPTPAETGIRNLHV